MVTIATCQDLHQDWLRILARATGGRAFSTHESEWLWLPARRQLVLLYPQRISPAGIRTGLTEATRLRAQSVSVWMNNAVSYAPLEAFGFRRGPQPLWMSARAAVPQGYNAASAAVDPEPAEITGPDAAELAAGRIHPRTAWHLTTRGGDKLTGRAWLFVPSAADQQAGLQVPDTGLQPEPSRPLPNLPVPDLPPTKQKLPAEIPAGIFSLAVGPSSRRRGYGTALLSRAAAVAASAGADTLVINAAPSGQDLCEARGFGLIGRGQYLNLDLR